MLSDPDSLATVTRSRACLPKDDGDLPKTDVSELQAEDAAKVPPIATLGDIDLLLESPPTIVIPVDPVAAAFEHTTSEPPDLSKENAPLIVRK